MESEKVKLLARIEDTVRLSQKHGTAKFTAFLTEEEQAEIADFAAYGVNIAYFGGYPEAKRRMLGAFPEWEEEDTEQFPIRIIYLEKKYPKELTHRDYLGTILSLRVERNKLGDILVSEDGAYVFADSAISDVILHEVEKVANCGIKTSYVKLKDITLPEQEYDDLFVISASMRLDALIASVTKLSRSRAVNLISSGKVSKNHVVTDNVSAQVAQGDTLSVRGYGRYIVFSEGGRTGSGRLHVHIKKFR